MVREYNVVNNIDIVPHSAHTDSLSPVSQSVYVDVCFRSTGSFSVPRVLKVVRLPSQPDHFD